MSGSYRAKRDLGSGFISYWGASVSGVLVFWFYLKAQRQRSVGYSMGVRIRGALGDIDPLNWSLLREP